MSTKIVVWEDTCPAFELNCIGSRVMDRGAFMAALETAIKAREDLNPCIRLDKHAPYVLSGVQLRAEVDTYVSREHRGVHMPYALRLRNGPRADRLVAITLTREQFLGDAEIAEVANAEEQIGDATHVVIAVVAWHSDEDLLPQDGMAPQPATTFLRNMAGGNSRELNATGDELRTTAVDVYAYDSKWATVAD